jgi:hypothetical protein
MILTTLESVNALGIILALFSFASKCLTPPPHRVTIRPLFNGG